ncbi:MAG: GTPase domain-containing protein [Ilumatobacter sp.]|uniref:ABC transporter n=1 Tax=Ilumatobacter sp. TaxID=1967498 RepID=UPI003C72B364
MNTTIDALTALRAALDSIALTLPLDSADRGTEVHDELLGQIDDYLLPRLARLDAPLLVVLGGSTGAGKSTITNSLVGSDVSLAGVLRPSTRTPVLVCNSADRSWFLDGGVLPDLPRTTGERPTGAGLHLVVNDRVPAGLGLLDAPDIDSVELANHELAAQLLGAADAWLFVTTASRYADAVPWEYLRRARERAVAMTIVINRIPTGASDEVAAHLGDMLRQNGLGDITVFTIEEAPTVAAAQDVPDATDHFVEGRLQETAIGELRSWVGGLIADDASRDDVVRTTLDGALRSIPARVDVVEDALGDQSAAVEQLAATSRRRYEDALSALDDELGNGVLLRGEVLDRWREHVGTSAFMERLQHGVSRVRARVWSVLSRKPIPSEAAKDQLESNLVTLVRNHADRAAVATVSEWDTTAAGAAVLAGAERGIDRPTANLPDRLERELDDWHDAVLQLVQDRAGNKLAVARSLTLGLNGVGVAVMVGVFAQTGGVTGAEAGVAAGTAAVSQTLLTAVFGENAVRDLVRAARDDLRLRLAGIFEVERGRFDALLRSHSSGDGDALRRASEELISSWTRQGRA